MVFAVSFLGGRKRIKDIKVPMNKKKRASTVSAVSSEDESRTEAVVKTPKSTKKQKVIQEKETRKVQKVNHHHFFSSLTHIHISRVAALWIQFFRFQYTKKNLLLLSVFQFELILLFLYRNKPVEFGVYLVKLRPIVVFVSFLWICRRIYWRFIWMA